MSAAKDSGGMKTQAEQYKCGICFEIAYPSMLPWGYFNDISGLTHRKMHGYVEEKNHPQTRTLYHHFHSTYKHAEIDKKILTTGITAT